MFLLRKLGKLLRGNVTPFQIISATIIGGIIGFSAPPTVAPGLYLALFVIVLIINCNLLLFALSGALGYIISLVLTPLSLSIGKFLLTGPVSGLFEALVNAPVIAWFGWEYYVYAGALPIAIFYGVILGMAIDGTLHSYKVKMANLEENSERFNKLTNNPLFKFTAFIFIGGFKGKKGFQESLEQSRKGLPIRITGALVVALAVPTAWAMLNMFDTAFYTTRIREALEQANEATVDLASAEIDYFNGRISLKGLALADPQELSRNRLSSEEITADISWSHLLAKQVVVEEITVASTLVNSQRRVQGSDDIETPKDTPEPQKPKPAPGPTIPGIPDSISTEDITENYDTAKQVLGDIKEYIEERETEESAPREDAEALTWQQRLEQQIAESGMRGARAEHLLKETPTVTINAIAVRDLRVTGADLGIIDIDAAWISDAPALVEHSPEITITNRSEQLFAHMRADTLRDPSAESPIKIEAKDFNIDTIRGALPQDVEQSVEAGTFSVTAEGTLKGQALNIPINAQLKALEVQVPHLGLRKIDSLAIGGVLSGPIDAPSLELDTQQLQKELQKAAQNLIQDAAKELLNSELGGDESEGGGIKDILKGFLNR